MAKDETFDITTGADLQEVDNALNQARKEISTRFDFKNVLAEIEWDKTKAEITVHTTDEYKLDAIWQALTQRFIARSVPLKNLVRGTIEQAAQGTVRQHVTSRSRSIRIRAEDRQGHQGGEVQEGAVVGAGRRGARFTARAGTSCSR